MGPSSAASSPDLERLRRERLARCFAAMAESGTDALVLGREANVRFVTDAHRLWLAGARPFGPVCVAVAATREIHLLSNSDEGVPAAIPAANLYPLTWSPDVLATRLARVPGLGTARQIGIDGWNAAAGRLLAEVAPGARLVDGQALLHAVRRRKSADEIACLRAALGIAAAGLEAVIASLDAGVDENRLRGVFAETVAGLGATIPSLEGRFRSIVGGERRFAADDLVSLRCGVMLAGYEGTLARTWPCTTARGESPATAALVERGRKLSEALAARCRSGETAADLLGAYARSGEPLPPFAIAHGVGLGCEPPLVAAGQGCDPDTHLEPGMVLSVRAAIPTAGPGHYEVEEVVRVGDEGGDLLWAFPHGPWDARQ
jgi:Xaa-Pro aminopeptidase